MRLHRGHGERHLPGTGVHRPEAIGRVLPGGPGSSSGAGPAAGLSPMGPADGVVAIGSHLNYTVITTTGPTRVHPDVLPERKRSGAACASCRR